jgi:Ribbon-helix-helix protein, copG family.
MDQTPRRTIRVPDHVWHAARQKARQRGSTVSEVVRRSLERWVKRDAA